MATNFYPLDLTYILILMYHQIRNIIQNPHMALNLNHTGAS